MKYQVILRSRLGFYKKTYSDDAPPVIEYGGVQYHKVEHLSATVFYEERVVGIGGVNAIFIDRYGFEARTNAHGETFSIPVRMDRTRTDGIGRVYAECRECRSSWENPPPFSRVFAKTDEKRDGLPVYKETAQIK